MESQGKFKQILLTAPLLIALSGGFFGSANAATFTVDAVFDGIDANPGDGICATGGG